MDGKFLTQTLVGMRLTYGIKSPDMDLYDLGIGPYVLHAVCPFEIRDNSGVETFDIDTPASQFDGRMTRLLGRTVKRAALSDKNDLWLDFGICHVVFMTWEDGEESWRLFQPGGSHWIATDRVLEEQ